MFKCQLSGRQSLPGQKPQSLVVSRRRKSYDQRIYDLETRTISVIKDATQGWEVVKELTVCESAYNEWIAAHPNGPEWVGEVLQEDLITNDQSEA